jgi:hypothetical protein
MLSSVYATVPAGVLGSGSVVARPHACAAVRPALLGTVAGVGGTGVSTTGLPAAAAARPAGMAPRFRGWAPQGTDLPTALPIRTQSDPITQNDGTTPLGDHSSGRPLS